MILLMLAISSLSLGDTRIFLSVLLPLKVYCHSMFLANVFNTFTDAWNIRNNYVASLYGFVGCSWSVFVFFSLLLLFENLLNGPLGILAMAKCFLQMVQFFFQELRS